MSEPRSVDDLKELTVKVMTALVVSRSGRGPKATSNKDGAIALETLGLLSSPRVLVTPPPSPERQRTEDADGGNAGGEGGMESELEDEELQAPSIAGY